MAKVGGAGSQNLPGLSYQPNNGMPGGVAQSGWGQIPINTQIYTGQPGANFPDPSGLDPCAKIQEFWPSSGRGGLNR